MTWSIFFALVRMARIVLSILASFSFQLTGLTSCAAYRWTHGSLDGSSRETTWSFSPCSW